MENCDEALFDAHRQGDPNAFGLLVRRYSTVLLGYLTRMIGERQQAEDLFQETFLRVHTKGHSFRRGAKFKPWLFTIATRLAIDTIRKRTRTPLLLPGQNDQADDRQIIPDIADPCPNPDTAAQQADLRAAVRAAVDALPGRQRAALILSYYEGHSYSEAAAIMKCSVGTVKTHMSRALNSLSRSLPDPRGDNL